MHWLIRAIRHIWLSWSEVPVNIRSWRATEEGQRLLRELGIREVVLEPVPWARSSCVH